ncbi:MAG: redox-sensitive transcriptional activator SoxR [Pseudomonadota bacterium]
MKRDDLISIGDLAGRTGLSVSAIRFYENKGLIEPFRTSGGQRRFFRADIRRLSFIQIAQGLGFTLEDIKEQLDTLPLSRTPTGKDWEIISRNFRQVLDDRITRMTRLRDTLTGCIGCGCLSLKRCALYNPDDRAREFGPGPRYFLGDRPEVESNKRGGGQPRPGRAFPAARKKS